VSCPAPPILYFILGAEPALNNLSEFGGPPQARWPAHSVHPSMVQELEDLEDELEKAKKD